LFSKPKIYVSHSYMVVIV